MATVRKGPHDTLESMLSKFRRKCMMEGIVKEMKSREAYEKPSDRKRRKKNEATRARYIEELRASKVKSYNK